MLAAMSYFFALAIEGALAGAIYALVALAFVLVYKASAIMNFALGEWVGLGAVLSGAGLQGLQLGVLGAAALAGLAMASLAASFYLVAVRRLVGRPAIAAVMLTLGLGMLMRAAGLLLLPGLAGPGPASLANDPVSLGAVSTSAGRLVAAAVAALGVALMAGFYRFTRAGIALRAIADDVQAAMAAGIDVDRHLLMVWALAGLVAAVAGLLWASVNGGGFGVALIGLKLFPIVILGGLDSILGTVVAAVAVGVLESLAAGYLDGVLGSGFGGIAPYLLLLAMLMLRPHGLFGQSRVERV
jgi:branched-chain amino acid transport system permease protein